MVIALSLAIRVILFLNFPIALTADSWDYLSAAEGVYQHADFNSYAFRDIRLPVYPIFLAVIHPLTDMRSDRIVLFQNVIGLFNVALGMLIGYQLGSSFVAVGLGLFSGLNPVYLLNEHAVMTEALCLFSLLLFTVVAIPCLTRTLDRRRGLMLGLTTGICTLIRPNALLFCGIFVLGVLIYRLMGPHVSSNVPTKRTLLIFVLATGLGTGLIVGPWLWRNYTLYSNISLANFNNRNLLIFKVLHGAVDYTLPELKQTNAVLGSSTVDFDWLLRLAHAYPTVQAEAVAGKLFWEQIATHPTGYLREIADSAAAFGGFIGFTGNDRTAVLYWFTSIVNNPQLWYEIDNPSYAKKSSPDFSYIPVSANASLGIDWSVAGQIYLRLIRPALYALFFGLTFAYIRKKKLNTMKTADLPAQVMVLLAGSYLVIIAFHSITLLDSDRYSSLFDWMPLLIILLITWQRFKAASPKDLHNPSALDVGSNAGYTSRFN